MIAISLSMLVILASLYFLVKIKTENMGTLYKWITLLILFIALIMFGFQSFRSCSKFWHRKICTGTECGSSYHHHGMKGMHWQHKSGRDNCCGMHGRNYEFFSDDTGDSVMVNRMKKRMMMDQGAEVIRESVTDTIDGKIIIKETEIIKK